jgi:putative hydrolase of HD superfamily
LSGKHEGGGAEGLLAFCSRVGDLKRVERRGWQRCGVPRPESVADHSLRLALLALVLGRDHPSGLDAERAVALALVHDLAEAIVGDITPYDGVDRAEKRRREAAAMEKIADEAGDERLLRLWQEYDAGESSEARFVKSLDSFETVLQSAEYERLGEAQAADMEDFWASASERVVDPVVAALYGALAEARTAGGEPDEPA